jgi:hypothetical protein
MRCANRACRQTLCDSIQVLSLQHRWALDGQSAEDACYVNALRPGSYSCGPLRLERMAQGRMSVSDVSCSGCLTPVGWRFGIAPGVTTADQRRPNVNQEGRFGLVMSAFVIQNPETTEHNDSEEEVEDVSSDSDEPPLSEEEPEEEEENEEQHQHGAQLQTQEMQLQHADELAAEPVQEQEPAEEEHSSRLRRTLRRLLNRSPPPAPQAAAAPIALPQAAPPRGMALPDDDAPRRQGGCC